MSVDLIDKSISALNPKIQELELLALTCIFMASKYEEIYPPPLKELIKGSNVGIQDVI